jgi:hypothetical protein
MGQYFYFTNDDGEISKTPIQSNFGLPWMKSLERIDDLEKIKVFKEVIQKNFWLTKKVYAIGDYGYTIVYDTNGNFIETHFNPHIHKK